MLPVQRQQGGRFRSLLAFPEHKPQNSVTVGGSAGTTLNSKSNAEELIPCFQLSSNASVVSVRKSRAGTSGSLT